MYTTKPDYDSAPSSKVLHSSSSDPKDITSTESDPVSERPAPISERSGPEDESTEYDEWGERKASGVGTLPPAFVERGEVGGRAEMTTTRELSDQEWEDLIEETEVKVQDVVREGKTYEVPESLAETIDHTLLKLDATAEQVERLCEEAKQERFATVCVRPTWVSLCASHLHTTTIPVASVIGFHEGTYTLEHKLSETSLSLRSGALELDIVLNYPDLVAKQHAATYTELSTLRSHAPSPVVLKLILETSQLTSHEIIAACTIAGAAGFDFVKTSTGFNGEGATAGNVRLMRACCEVLREKGGRGMRVKASGGIRTVGDARQMLEAGAQRLGCSAGVTIVEEVRGGKVSRVKEDSGGY